MSAWTRILDIAAVGKIPEQRVSPFIKSLDFPTVCSWHDRTVSGSWQATDKVHQDSGVVFGGYLSALADYFAGSAMLTVLEDNEIFFTKNLQIEYRRPIRTGAVSIVATVIEKAEMSALVEVVFCNAKNDVIAVASIRQTVFSK